MASGEKPAGWERAFIAGASVGEAAEPVAVGQCGLRVRQFNALADILSDAFPVCPKEVSG